MDLSQSRQFFESDASALSVYARDTARDLGLDISATYLPSVLENLATLQAHAAIVAAALDKAGSPEARVAGS